MRMCLSLMLRVLFVKRSFFFMLWVFCMLVFLMLLAVAVAVGVAWRTAERVEGCITIRRGSRVTAVSVARTRMFFEAGLQPDRCEYEKQRDNERVYFVSHLRLTSAMRKQSITYATKIGRQIRGFWRMTKPGHTKSCDRATR